MPTRRGEIPSPLSNLAPSGGKIRKKSPIFSAACVLPLYRCLTFRPSFPHERSFLLSLSYDIGPFCSHRDESPFYARRVSSYDGLPSAPLPPLTLASVLAVLYPFAIETHLIQKFPPADSSHQTPPFRLIMINFIFVLSFTSILLPSPVFALFLD